MANRTMTAAALAAALLALTLMAGCAGSETTQPATPETPATTPAETPAEAPATDQGGDSEFVRTKCTMCHTYDRVESADYDQAGWTDVVTRMQQNGLVITDEEKTKIIEFLSAK